jgi:hypothetical protein
MVRDGIEFAAEGYELVSLNTKNCFTQVMIYWPIDFILMHVLLNRDVTNL